MSAIKDFITFLKTFCKWSNVFEHTQRTTSGQKYLTKFKICLIWSINLWTIRWIKHSTVVKWGFHQMLERIFMVFHHSWNIPFQEPKIVARFLERSWLKSLSAGSLQFKVQPLYRRCHSAPGTAVHTMNRFPSLE